MDVTRYPYQYHAQSAAKALFPQDAEDGPED
jgi:hypothetical protein